MDTKPNAVTIFPDRARVTRSGQVDLKPGLQRVEISNLPLALIPESVRASGKGTAKAKLLGVTTRMDNFTETPTESVQELETKIQELADADANLSARSSILEKDQKALDGLAAQSEMFARGLSFRNRTPEEQGIIFDFITRRGQAIQTELLSLARSRRDKTKEIDRLKRILQGHQAARPKQRYVATIELDVLTEGNLTIELTYIVRNANWKPLYDLRMTDTVLEVTYMAQVSQNTGEDWPNVKITLSTAEPSLSLEIPELDPWYIAPRQPVYPRSAPLAKRAMAMPAPAAAMMGGARDEEEADMAKFAMAEAAPEQEMEADSASVSASGASLTYQLSASSDVPGNNDPRKVTVASFQLKPTLDYVTAPKIEEVCYRRAKVKNESSYSLLPGPAQLFDGDTYLGTTQLEFVAPNQEFELVLGSDERIRVDRQLVQREVEKAFIVGDRKRIRYGYTITIDSLREGLQTIYVRDQLPVPRDEQIKVRLETADPKPSDYNHLNLLEWKLSLAPGSKTVIRFDFSVEYPRTLDVVGLP
jgi:uncharacterized protein (TIGR02231 family)